MSVVVRKAGILATVQDLGRYGFRRSGINPNGAMDVQAVRLINILLGNQDSDPVLELHFPAPLFEFNENAVIALGGADFAAAVDDQPVDNWRPVFVKKGALLRFLDKTHGNRAYLAVKGGFDTARWLGSASTNLLAKQGGFSGRALQAGDEIALAENCSGLPAHYSYLTSGELFTSSGCRDNAIRVIAGAEFARLTALSEQIFLHNEFKIAANSDRMGFRLSGAPLELFERSELLSSAVDFGTIQLLPDGQLIILMADHQTTGGYARIAHVISCDRGALAQRGVNDKVRFELVSVSQAEELILRNEAELNYLRFAVKQKFASI